MGGHLTLGLPLCSQNVTSFHNRRGLHDLEPLLLWYSPRLLSFHELVLADGLVLLDVDGGGTWGASGGYRGAICYRVRPWHPDVIIIVIFGVCALYKQF